MKTKIDEICLLAKRIRKDILDMTFNSGVNGGHIGGAFSSADILAVLYGDVMNITPANSLSDERDRFILSKGHCSIAHYAVLAECGFLTHEDMMSFEVSGSTFSTHEEMNVAKGIEISSGSLGYGLSVATGIALNGKIKNKNYKVYVLLGDGECNEGAIWEAAMAASKYRLDNLVAVVDVNGQSLDGYIENTMPISHFADVWSGFGWYVQEVDGHDIFALESAFNSLSCDAPNVIMAKTMKMKGISSVEGNEGWHHTRLDKEQYLSLIDELEGEPL